MPPQEPSNNYDKAFSKPFSSTPEAKIPGDKSICHAGRYPAQYIYWKARGALIDIAEMAEDDGLERHAGDHVPLFLMSHGQLSATRSSF